MKFKYKPKSKLEKFGEKVFKLLVDNFPQTFYVGGMVRDLLLHREITDIDIATQAKPDDIIKTLSKAGITADTGHKQFGVIIAKNINCSVEIATFRKDIYGNSRYPKITFVKTPKQDSQRRDFTINALYLSPKLGTILDFYMGLKDLKLKRLKFIGNPQKRIMEDPLRIVRALRFAKTLDLKLELPTGKAIENNFSLIKTLTKSRIESELKKIKNIGQKKIAAAAINRQTLLDIK
jgi:tRNA nucleotidyltransferase (CCA-adding enzyme)